MPEHEGAAGVARHEAEGRRPRGELGSSRWGHMFTNPVTGERAVVLTDPETHPDRTFVAHLFVRPGGRVAAPHVHPGATERFYVLAGRVGFEVGGRRRELEAGRSREVPPGASHDWWQIGEEEAQAVSLTAYRDTVVFSTPPPLVQRLLFGVLAPIGRLVGKQSVYPEYLFSRDLVEPAAEGLALLDLHGRLRRDTSIDAGT